MDNENNNNVNFRLIDEEDKSTYESNGYRHNENNGPNKKKQRSNVSYITVSIISAIIGGLIVSLINPVIYKNNISGQYGNGSNQQINITPKDEPTTVEAVAKKSMKSVVGITTTEVVQDFFQQRQVQGTGSGVIVDSKGYILTNSHVIGDGAAQNITVMFENGDKKAAKILWFEKTLDLAIIKVEGSNYPAADLGNSEDLNIGEIAVAIGNPLGLDFERTVTAGYISGLNRTIQVDQYNKIENLIQTDASINNGNSGGPLLNSKGEVIGINTLKLTSAEGLGFALPINIAKPIIEQVIKEGKYTSVYIGIGGNSVAKYKSVGIEVGVEEGVVVSAVEPGSPAEKAGINKMDIVVSLDDKKIDSLETLRKELYKYKPGDKVKIGVIKENKKTEVELILGEKTE